MFIWLRVIILLVAGSLISFQFFTAPDCIYINGKKLKYIPYINTIWESYLYEQTKDWRDIILRDKTFHEQPLENRLQIANNFYFREIATKEKVGSQPDVIKKNLKEHLQNTARVMDLNTFRSLFSEYDDLPDNQIKIKIYEKFYKKDISKQEFDDSFLRKSFDGNEVQTVKIPGPHYSMLPSKDLTVLVSRTFVIIISAAILYFILFILEKRYIKTDRSKRKL